MKDYNQALYHEIFIKEEYQIIKPLLPSAKIIFDIWGHIWYFSERCLKYNPDLTIHFFEPFPQLIAEAKTRLSTQNIVFNNLAIAKNSWKKTFFFNTQKPMQSSQNTSFLNPNGIAQSLQTKNLNEYLQDHQIEQIDIMKIDTEGMEYEILDSLSENNRKKIKNLILEIHLLQESDFDLFLHMKDKLKREFSRIEIIDSPYTSKIKLAFCQR